MEHLVEDSLLLLISQQTKNGSFPLYADSNSPCWLDEGAMSSIALDLHGEHKKARNFLYWAHNAIMNDYHEIKSDLPDTFLSSIFDIDGITINEITQHFNLYPFALYLDAVSTHISESRGMFIIDDLSDSLNIVIKLLVQTWDIPSIPIWEPSSLLSSVVYEQTAKLAIYSVTLANVIHALKKIGNYITTPQISESLNIMKQTLKKMTKRKDCLLSYREDLEWRDTDAYLPLLSILDNTINMSTLHGTIESIRNNLQVNIGVKRTNCDDFFGGAEWLEPTMYLLWYEWVRGNRSAASDIFSWLELLNKRYSGLPRFIPNEKAHGYSTLWKPYERENIFPSLRSHASLLKISAITGIE